jgi:hypothetical protein
MIRRMLVLPTILALLATGCSVAPRREVVPMRPTTTEMTVYRSEVVHVSILIPPQRTFDFLADVSNWKTWAPWVRGAKKVSDHDWTVDTDAGTLQLRFVEANSLGVLDHTVTLASGVRIYNAMRVSPNSTGSELSMVVLQTPPATSEQFAQDVQAVRDDFARIKKVLESDPGASGR